MCACANNSKIFFYNKVSLFTSGVTSEGSDVLGLRKFGACSAVSVGRLALVEGGLVWRLVAGAWAFVVTLLWRFGMLMRIYTPKDTGAIVLITESTTILYSNSKNIYIMFQIIYTTKMNNMWPIWVHTNFTLLFNNLLFHSVPNQLTSIIVHVRPNSMFTDSRGLIKQFISNFMLKIFIFNVITISAISMGSGRPN